MFNAQRKTVDEWAFHELNADKIMKCDYCDVPTTPMILAALVTTSAITWGTDRWVEERLDRAVASESWYERHPHCVVHSIQALTSDHVALFLDLEPPPEGPRDKWFRFENAWLLDKGCKEVVVQAWDGTANLRLEDCLSFCAGRLQDWGGDTFRNFGRKIKLLRSRLRLLRRKRDQASVDDFKAVNTELKLLFAQRDVYWKQRAKAHWLKDGDRKMKFFHRSATSRKRKNHISRLRDENGNWVEGEPLRDRIQRYYQGIFSSGGSASFAALGGLLHRVSQGQNDDLIRPYTTEEVKAALFSMFSDKAPGPDGTVSGWGAHDTSGKITPYTFKRRENGEDDVTIKILYCGICHTDLHFAKNDWGITMYPVVPEHEIIGLITKVGSNVTNFKVGDRAGLGCLAATCLKCEYCKEGHENYCDQVHFVYNGIFWDGSITYGGYSEFLVADHRYVVRVPENLAMDAAAPLLCAGITVYSPMKDNGLLETKGKRIGVVGLGGLGHIAVKFAKAFDHHVTVISTSPSKEKEARENLGVDDFILSTNDEQMLVIEEKDLILNTVSAKHSLGEATNLATLPQRHITGPLLRKTNCLSDGLTTTILLLESLHRTSPSQDPKNDLTSPCTESVLEILVFKFIIFRPAPLFKFIIFTPAPLFMTRSWASFLELEFSTCRDPVFIHKHVENSSSRNEAQLLVINKGAGVKMINLNKGAGLKMINLNTNISKTLSVQGDVKSFLGSCDGLVLCKLSNSKIDVVNPSLKQFVLRNRGPVICLCGRVARFVASWFGHHPHTKEYVLVLVDRVRRTVRFRVFTLSRRISNPQISESELTLHGAPFEASGTMGVFLNDKLHFPFRVRDAVSTKMTILICDFQDEGTIQTMKC
ncbi:hypothetical protein OROHE_017961 [Orobanche hederae]